MLLKKVKENTPVLILVLKDAGIAGNPLATPDPAPTIPPNAATTYSVNEELGKEREERKGRTESESAVNYF